MSDQAAIDAEFGVEAPEPAHYTDQRLQRVAGYVGPAKRLDDDHAEAMLCELLENYESELPPPPVGLPGTSVGWQPDRATMRLLQIGFDYFVALARREPRRQRNLYEAAEAALRREWRVGHDEAEDGQLQRRIEEALRFEERRPQTEDLVYFIGSDAGPVKIGKSRMPTARLKELQTGHHERLTILATVAGGERREAAYHIQFAEHRRHGEWFDRAPEILAEIERLRNPATLVQREHVGMAVAL